MVKPTGEITFDEYLNQKLGPKSRKSLNYDKRSLEKAGDVSWEDYDQFEEVRSGDARQLPGGVAVPQEYGERWSLLHSKAGFLL